MMTRMMDVTGRGGHSEVLGCGGNQATVGCEGRRRPGRLSSCAGEASESRLRQLQRPARAPLPVRPAPPAERDAACRGARAVRPGKERTASRPS
jgi:hypothetical protein